jgi:hypothetical protein
MDHKAIYALYSDVKTISGSGANAVAKDADGNVVTLDSAAVTTKQNEFIAAENLRLLRLKRNELLAETDYLALSDTTLTSAMSTYRQALRDITSSATSLDDVTWPTKP